MKTITLYTGLDGYKLFEMGLPFVASITKYSNQDYKVIAPLENIIDFPLEDEIECYDVVRMNGVIVEEIKN